MSLRHFSRCFLSLALFVFAACGGPQNQQTQLPSSAQSPAYALSQPAEMEANAARFDAELSQAQTLLEQLPNYPDALSAPDWQLVGKLYQDANDAPRTEDVAEGFAEQTLLTEYLAEASAEQAKRAERAVESTLQKEGVVSEAKFRGGIKYALEAANTDALKERLGKMLGCIQELELEREALGKDNATALEEQLFAIAWMSWWLHVGSDKALQKLERQLAESDTIQDTLDKAIAERQRRVDDPEGSKASKKESETQLASLKTAREGFEAKRNAVQDGMEKRRTALKTAREQYL
ncbi:MAG: hypothetical protein RBU37_16255 [Myxococcota bacterium]|jgi:hypothetical protein|nr:hypothetical protein [Myxococcota bacterium]